MDTYRHLFSCILRNPDLKLQIFVKEETQSLWIQDRRPEQRNRGIGQEMMMIVDLFGSHTIRVEERETGIRGIALLVS